MKKKAFHTFLLRFLLIYAVHLIVKWGDETFLDFFDITWRGCLFSIFFIGLWMIALYLLDYVKKKWFPPRRARFLYFGFYVFYGYLFAFLTNAGYYFGDTLIYGNVNAWRSIGVFNPVLTFSLLLIFMAVVGFYEYFQTEIAAKENQVLNEKLKKEIAIADYKLLKSQIEPHFLFNSLSVLSTLVGKNPDLATDFISKLSKILRFAIDQNDQMYVSFSEEFDFMMNYFFLVQTRFGKAIKLIDQFSLQNRDAIVLPPYTFQILVENAVKHNKYSAEKPLEIRLRNDEGFIVVSNRINLKEISEQSTKTGLTNLSKRFELLCGRKVRSHINAGDFIVKIPLIKKEAYEGIDL